MVLALDSAAAGEGAVEPPGLLIVAQRDPFRLDTAANHRDGEWLGQRVADLGLG